MIFRWHPLRLPAGQTENRDGSGGESGRFQAFRRVTTRSTGGRNPAWRGDSRQEKGPGDYPSPCVWWWGSTPHQTTIESTESKRCGLLRSRANRIEKPAGTAIGRGRSSRFFALIGARKGRSTSSAFRRQFNSFLGIEPASDAPTKSTPIHTHFEMRRPVVRRLAPPFSALYAAKDLRVRRMQPIISA